MLKELAAHRRPSATAATPLLALCFFWSPLQAQTLRQLDNIIFEPVPLEADAGTAPVFALQPGAPARPLLQHVPPLGPAAAASDAWLSPASASAFAPRVHDGLSFLSSPDAPEQPSSAFAGGDLDGDGGTGARLSATIEAWEARLDELEADKGPYSIDLAAPLIEFARWLQRQGRHDSALPVLERSEHIFRVNHGLYALEQAPAVELGIESLLALGRMQEADERRHYLHFLHEQVYGESDPRLVDSLLGLAEWNMNAFQRGLRFEAESMFIESEFGRAGSEKEVRQRAFGKLRQARRSYLQAISTLLEKQQYQDPRLPGLEARLVESYFLEAHRDSLLKDPVNYLDYSRSGTGTLLRRRFELTRTPVYTYGRDSYLRTLVYLQSDPQAPASARADTLLGLGDWHLLFGRLGPAQESYVEAQSLLAQSGMDSQEVDGLLNPAVPVRLPAFTATPHTREIQGIPAGRDLLYQGYVDVAFHLSRTGRAEDPEILASSPGTARSVERRLRRLLRDSLFRPRIGREEEEEEIRLRYYYSY